MTSPRTAATPQPEPAAHIRRTQPRARTRGAARARWRFELNNTPYQPVTYCGAPITSNDWDRRSAVAATHAAQAEREVCPACLTAARQETKETR